MVSRTSSVGEDDRARTLDDLAALSGVSRATVSRVLNGGNVAERTRRRVLEVVERTTTTVTGRLRPVSSTARATTSPA